MTVTKNGLTIANHGLIFHMVYIINQLVAIGVGWFIAVMLRYFYWENQLYNP